MAVFVELVAIAQAVAAASPVATAIGVAYLVVVDRRRARKLHELENNTQALIAGHSSAGAHRALTQQVQELNAHVAAQH